MNTMVNVPASLQRLTALHETGLQLSQSLLDTHTSLDDFANQLVCMAFLSNRLIEADAIAAEQFKAELARLHFKSQNYFAQICRWLVMQEGETAEEFNSRFRGDARKTWNRIVLATEQLCTRFKTDKDPTYEEVREFMEETMGGYVSMADTLNKKKSKEARQAAELRRENAVQRVLEAEERAAATLEEQFQAQSLATGRTVVEIRADFYSNQRKKSLQAVYAEHEQYQRRLVANGRLLTGPTPVGTWKITTPEGDVALRDDDVLHILTVITGRNPTEALAIQPPISQAA